MFVVMDNEEALPTLPLRSSYAQNSNYTHTYSCQDAQYKCTNGKIIVFGFYMLPKESKIRTTHVTLVDPSLFLSISQNSSMFQYHKMCLSAIFKYRLQIFLKNG